MKRRNPMTCMFRLNVGEVKIMTCMSYITSIMRILGHKIFHRKLKINSMAIRTGNVEYIMTQKDHKCRYQKCAFHLSTPPPLEFGCLTCNTNAKQGIFCRFR